MKRSQQRLMGVAGLTVTLLLSMVATPASAASYANPGLLIETEELARSLDDPDLRIVELRRDADKGGEAYRTGHIPGAVLLAAGELDDAGANTKGFPIPPDKAAELFSRLGIDHTTRVVAYDNAGGLLAARLFFVLEYYGHNRTRVLNGGLQKWREEDRPLASGVTSVASKDFEPRPQRDRLATVEEVKTALDDEKVFLLDARSPDEFTGKVLRAERGGHIPGARNVNWTTTLNPDKTFKSADELRTVFEKAGTRPEHQIITYCQSGVRAAHDYFALRLLGYTKVKNYDGSWMEWGNDPDLPVER